MAQEVSALMQALYTGDTAKVEELLRGGPELDVFEAAGLGRVERLRELLEANPELARAWSSDRATALHFAAFFRQPEATRLLVERGADLEAVSPTFGDVTPLHSACASGERESARILLEAGADPEAATDDGRKPRDFGLADLLA